MSTQRTLHGMQHLIDTKRFHDEIVRTIAQGLNRHFQIGKCCHIDNMSQDTAIP